MLFAWNVFPYFLLQLKHAREKFHHEFCFLTGFSWEKKKPMGFSSYNIVCLTFLWKVGNVQTLLRWHWDGELETQKLQLCLGYSGPGKSVWKIHFVFDSLKCAAKLNLALCFVLKNVEDRSFRFCYAHKNTIGEIKSCGYYRRQDKTQESPK